MITFARNRRPSNASAIACGLGLVLKKSWVSPAAAICRKNTCSAFELSIVSVCWVHSLRPACAPPSISAVIFHIGLSVLDLVASVSTILTS